MQKSAIETGMSSVDELEALLLALLSLSQKMVGAARLGEWDSVVELERQRSPQVRLLSSRVNDAGTRGEIQTLWHQTISSVIESDKEVAMLAAALQQQLSKGLSNMESSRKALSAYLDNL